MSSVAIERLTMLRNQLATLTDEQLDMHDWMSVEEPKIDDCGTVACALGWACLLPEFKAQGLTLEHPSGAPFPTFRTDGEVFHNYKAAQKFFQISSEHAQALFNPETYIEDEDEDEDWSFDEYGDEIIPLSAVIERFDQVIAELKAERP